MSPPRVLWVTQWFPSEPRDGRFNFIYRSAEALLALGVELRIVLVRPWVPPIGGLRNRVDARPPVGFAPEFDLRVISAPRLPRLVLLEQSYWAYRVLTDRRLRAQLDDFNPDVVHAHTEWAAYSAVSVARERGTPSVVSLHAADTTPAVRRLAMTGDRLRRTLLNADKVVLVGTTLRAYLAELGVPQDRADVVANGFVLPPDVIQSPGPDWTLPLRVVTTSILFEPKAVDIGIRAVARARERGVNLTYDIVGDGPERARLEALTRSLGLTSSVRFHGHLAHEDAMRCLIGAHIFALPSYREAFGVAALEGMAAGLVVIGVEGQGPADFVVPGKTGFLMPPRDVEAFASILCRIDGQRDEARRLASAGRAHAQTTMTWGAHGKQLVRIYESVRQANAQGMVARSRGT